MGRIRECPRCGNKAFEKLVSYAHCIECLYVEDYWENPESDYLQAQRVFDEVSEALERKNESDNLNELTQAGGNSAEQERKGA
jgi:hypothetical protein